MALSSFSIEAQGLDRRPYRIDVGSSPTTTVRGDRQFVVIEGGEQEDRGLDPIWPTELRAFARGIELDPSLLSGDDRSVPVKAFDTTGGTDTLVFSGYLVVDFFGDAPFEPEGIVEIRALDGLGTLENDSLGALFSGDPDTEEFVSYQTAITRFLQETIGTGLNVEFGVQWYPDRDSIGGTDNPLEYVGFDPDNYRDERPDSEGFQSQLDVLRDLLKSIGATVRQVDRRAEGADARWHVRQRDAINADGTIKTWVYSSYTDSPGPTTLDRSRSLSTGDILKDHSRDFIRRRQTVEVTHDHIGIENLIGDPGFENAGKGNSSPWNKLSFTNDYSATIEKHSNNSLTPAPRNKNQYVLRIQGSQAGGSGLDFVYGQPLGDLVETLPQTACAVEHTFYRSDNGFEIHFQLQIGSLYVGEFTNEVATDTLNGETAVEVKSGLDRPIPQGATLPIWPASQGSSSAVAKTTLTVSERAPSGASRVKCNLSDDINEGDILRYAGMQSSATSVPFSYWRTTAAFWSPLSVVFSLEDANGNVASGDMTYKVGGILGSATQFFIDDISLSLQRNGQPVDQTVTRATVPELGETEEQTVRTSSGPTTQNLARVRGNDPNGNSFEPTDWGIGASHTSTDSLAELKAFQRLRYWQVHLEELTVTQAARGGTLPLTGDELVTLEGTDYTVHSVRYDAAAGETRATLIEYTDFQS